MLRRLYDERAAIRRAREALAHEGKRERDLENLDALARSGVAFDWLYAFTAVDRLGARAHRLAAYADGRLVFVATNGLGSTAGLEDGREALERELEGSADLRSWDADALTAPHKEDA